MRLTRPPDLFAFGEHSQRSDKLCTKLKTTEKVKERHFPFHFMVKCGISTATFESDSPLLDVFEKLNYIHVSLCWSLQKSNAFNSPRTIFVM